MGAKLKLQPDPTFVRKVEIAVPGDGFTPVEFTFKYRSRAEVKALSERLKSLEDVDFILEVASGWELADAFGRESVSQLVENYLTAPRAVLEAYFDELSKVREKN